MSDSGRVIPFRKPARKTSKCPICGRPAQTETRPFCSRRCADVDLGRWLGGHYAVPTDEAPDGPPDEDEA